jgi:hypothetical protein
MNGRIYDYNLGRFLSVDPFIQSPGNSQSLNPYSYIMNNPLAGTDPSGYMSTCAASICQKDPSKKEINCNPVIGCSSYPGSWPPKSNGGDKKSGTNQKKDDKPVDEKESNSLESKKRNSLEQKQDEKPYRKMTMKQRIKKAKEAVVNIRKGIAGKGFDTIEEVVEELHDNFNKISMDYDIEIGASIYVGSNGKFFAQNIVIGGSESVRLIHGFKTFELAAD